MPTKTMKSEIIEEKLRNSVKEFNLIHTGFKPNLNKHTQMALMHEKSDIEK